MDAEQLPYLDTFVRAAELGSFTAAGRAQGLTQAAVSQRIRALEQVLRGPLFQRQNGRVMLTRAGHLLHNYAERILSLHRQAIQELTGHETPLTGELMLAASSVPGEHLLPELLAVFQRKMPHIQVRATVADSERVLHQVEHGDVHVGLVGSSRDDPNLEFRRFATDELKLVVPTTHAWGNRQRVPLSQVTRQPLIMREVGSGSRSCLEHALARAGKSLQELHVSLELGSNESIKEAVLRGLGVAILSTRTVAKEIDAGTLHTVEITGLPLSRDMFATWDRRRVLPIPARLFLDMLIAPPAS